MPDFISWLTSQLPYVSVKYMPLRSTQYPDHGDYNRWFKYHESRCRVMYGPESCQQIIEFILNDLDLPVPLITFDLDINIGGGMFTGTPDGSGRLSFPFYGTNGYVILHEIAHYMEYVIHGYDRYRATYTNRVTHHSSLFKTLLAQLTKSYPDIYDASDRFDRWKPSSVPETTLSFDPLVPEEE